MDQPTFYWEVVLRDGEAMLVSMQQAATVSEAIKRQRTHVEVNSQLIAVADIRRLRQSDKLIPREVSDRELSAGKGSGHQVVINPENGCVMWRWAKKVVSKRKYETYYSVHTGYRRLGNFYGGESVWVAFKRPLHENDSLPDGVEWCTSEEVQQIAGKVAV